MTIKYLQVLRFQKYNPIAIFYMKAPEYLQNAYKMLTKKMHKMPMLYT
jgi:hypothetical protein